MTQRTALCGTTAIFVALSGMAQADVTGAEVWENWKAAAESLGQVLTPGSQSQDGDTLTISNLAISMELPDVALTGGIDQIQFRDQGDGTVEITMSPSYTMMLNPSEGLPKDTQVGISVTQDGLTMIASGDADAVAYDFTAASMLIAVDNVIADGEPIELIVNLAANGIEGSCVVASGATTTVDSSVAMDSLDLNVDVREPGGDGFLIAKAKIDDLTAESSGNMMMMADIENMAQMLADGFATAANYSHGPATFEFQFQDRRDQAAFSGTAGSGALNVSLDAEAVAYSTETNDLAFTLSGSEIPLPEIAAAFGQIGFAFLMPVSANEAPQDFGMAVTLRDFSVSDMIWSMIDAGGQLPHDPATLVVDVSGQANWLFDILDPESAANMVSEMPAELHALDINELHLKLAGAELTGSGGFTFDNTDLMTFDGLPAPTGSLDLRLTGSNALMEKLVAMGLLPEDQAMMGQMMMGMFAEPDGDDSLTSKIEVDGATGAISANGQRLQ